MAERDLEFTAGVTFPAGQLTAEIQRITALMQNAGASVNLAAPLESAAAAARRARDDFRAVDLSLGNIQKSAKEVEGQYLAQQNALRKVEQAIRTIRELPITSPGQLNSLKELEALQKKLSSGTAFGGRSPLGPDQLAVSMSGATTAMQRFIAELKGVERAQAQVAIVSKQMRTVLESRIPVDPSFIQTLTTWRDTIERTGPVARSTFNQLQRGIVEYLDKLSSATQMELQWNQGLEKNQQAAMRVAGAYQTIERSLVSMDRAAIAAQVRAINNEERLLRLQARTAQLPQTPAVVDLSSRIAAVQGPGGADPVQVALVTAEYRKLKGSFDEATLSAAKFAAEQKQLQEGGALVARAANQMGSAFLQMGRQAETAGVQMSTIERKIAELQARAAKLPVTAQTTGIIQGLGEMQGPSFNRAQISAYETEVRKLELSQMAAAKASQTLARETESAGKAAKKHADDVGTLDKAMTSLTGRIARQTEFIIAAAASYAAFQIVTSVIQHVVALDEAMHRISATIDDQEEKARILPRTYALIQQGMTQFGQSTEDAGKLVLELTRSLGDLTQVNAAFLPALALTVRGEVNMADATKVLIGAVNAFGHELVGATDPLESFGVAADKIIKASNLSVGSIGTFSVALTNLAGRASVSNTTLGETLAALSLVQDSLGRAGQSGTGLARVFEGLLLHAGQLAEMFDIAFDPAKAVNPIELLGKTFAKLREEIRLTGGVSSETEAKIQKIIGTEQGTRIIELLIKDWEKFPARLKAITDSSGQHLRELKEHNEQLGVSFKNLSNSALVAVDAIMNAITRVFGGEGGAPGQFKALAQSFNTIAAGYLKFGSDVESAAEKIKKIIDAIASLRRPPEWLMWLISSPPGTPGAAVLDRVAQGFDAVGTAINKLPPGLPAWLNKLLFVGGAALLAGAVSGGTLTVPAALAAYLAFDATEYVLEAEKAQRATEKLAASTNKAAREMAIQSGHDPAAIGDQAAEDARNVELVRNRMLKERLTYINELEAKSANEIAQRNGELGILKQIASARANAAKSERDYQEARAKVVDDQKLSNLGEKDQAAGLEKISQLKKKSVADQNELNALTQTYTKNLREQSKEMSELAAKQTDSLAKLTKEWQKATESTATPFQDLTRSQADADILTRVRAVAKEMGGVFHGEFAIQVQDLITQTVIAELTEKQQKIVDAFVTPFRSASELAITEIDKVIERADYLARQPSLSLASIQEVKSTPERAVDIKLGVDVAERQLKSLTASFKLFGDEATNAAFAATKDFASFNDMIVQADLNAMVFGGRGLREMINGFLRLRTVTKEIDLQTVRNDIEATIKAIDTAMSTGGDPARIAANTAAWAARKKTLDELANSADAAERELAQLLLLDAQKKIELGNITSLTNQLETLKRTNDGIVASFGQTGAAALATQLAFQLEGVSVDKLTGQMQLLVKGIADATQKQKELGDTKGLIQIGIEPGRASSMAKSLATEQEELNKTIDAGTQALTKWNQRAEVSYQRQLEIVKQTALDSQDYFTFLTASFEQAATQGHEFYQDLNTLATNTANNMRSAFSDIFFATLQGNLKDAQAAFKNFFLSILREISNLMASQAVKGLMGLFGISSSGSGGPSLTGGGLLGMFSGGSAVGKPGGIGTSDITRPVGSGMNTAGFAAGEVGGDPFSAVKFAQAGNSVLSSAKAFAGAGDVWNAVSAGWTAGEGVFGGISEAATQGFAAMDAAFTGLNAVVGYAAAVISGILIVMDENKSDLGKGIQTATLAAGVAAAPWTAGLSIIAAGVINWIEDLFGLFDKGISKYTQKRIDASDQASRGIKTVGEGYQRASTSGDPGSVLQALRTKSEGVGTILMATPELAAKLGLNVAGYGPGRISDGKFEVSWDDVTTAQFNRLLEELAKDNPVQGVEGLTAGRAFVNYLPQDKVDQAQKQIGGIAEAMLAAFVAFQKVRNEVTKLSNDIADVVKTFLPPDLAHQFEVNFMNPIRQQITDTVTSGLSIDAVTVKLNNLKATLTAYVNLVDLYGQLTRDIAVYSGDFVKSLAFVEDQTKKAQEAAAKKVVTAGKAVGFGPGLIDESGRFNKTVDDLVGKVQSAFASMDLSPLDAFEKLAELRTAVIERYELEKKLVLEAEAGIQKLYTEHFSGILSLQQSLAELENSITGSDDGINRLVQSLLAIGSTSLSISESLYTASAAMDLFIKTLPTRIAGKAGREDDPSLGAGALPVDQILAATLGVVVPFAATLNREIRNAFNAGDFEAAFNLLQQFGAGLKSAMEAAVAGVRQWEAATIAANNRVADEQIKAGDAVRKSIQANIDAQRKYVDGTLREIQRQKDAIDDQKFAVTEQIRAIHDAMKPLENQIRSITRQQDALRRTQTTIHELMRPLEDQLKGLTRQQEVLQRAMRPLDAEIRKIEDLMRPLQDQLKAYDRNADLIQRSANDELWILGRRQRALDLNRRSLQDQIDLIHEMADAVSSVREYLHDLALSQQAPPDALGQFQLAKTTFDQLFTKFQAAPDAKGLGKLQDAAGDLMGTLEPLFARSSTEYRDLYEALVKKLEEATKTGSALGDPATLDDLEAQLKLVDNELETLNRTSESIRDATDVQLHAIELLKRPLEDSLLLGEKAIDAINDQKALLQRQIDAIEELKWPIEDQLALGRDALDALDRQIQILEEQKQPIQDQLDLGKEYLDALDDQLTWLDRQLVVLNRQETTLNRDLARIAEGQDWLNQAWQDYTDSVNAARDSANDATHAAADTIVGSIQEQMMPLMRAVGIDAHMFYEWMRNEQYQRLLDLTSGQGTAAWQREAQQSTARDLNLIQTMLTIFLNGDMRTVTAALSAPSTDERLISTLNNLDQSIGSLNSYLNSQGVLTPTTPQGTPPPITVVNPDPPNLGGSQHGTWETVHGMYELHPREMVVPSIQAEMLRGNANNWSSLGQLAQGGGGSDTYVTIAPVINSNQNPTVIVNTLVDRIVTDIRGGGAIQDAISRMPKRSR